MKVVVVRDGGSVGGSKVVKLVPLATVYLGWTTCKSVASPGRLECWPVWLCCDGLRDTCRGTLGAQHVVVFKHLSHGLSLYLVRMCGGEIL